ncbi:hypothetical protein [Parapedobacter soli]|uniref:hypothetical protein n=1 Tax=Parapedobacter soli TaxID=416955 RepID=UPI0021C7CB7F|nr:hypothetical protein [Parapedobacter soli]
MKKCHLTNGAANPTTNQHQGIDPQINRQLNGMGFRTYQTNKGLVVYESKFGQSLKIVVVYPSFMQLIGPEGTVVHLARPTIGLVRNAVGMFKALSKSVVNVNQSKN